MTDEKNRVPRAAALHDLSCFGRCALTVIDPVLSAMGIQCVPVPTALLSTHTGGFSDMYFCALDDAIRGIADHFVEKRAVQPAAAESNPAAKAGCFVEQKTLACLRF